jgi:predicted neuraminidase
MMRNCRGGKEMPILSPPKTRATPPDELGFPQSSPGRYNPRVANEPESRRPAGMVNLSKAAFWLVTAVAFALAVARCVERRAPGAFAWPHAKVAASSPDSDIRQSEIRNPKSEMYEEHFLPGADAAPSVHCSTITELPDGRLLAAWYGGSHECAGDVSIYSSLFDPRKREWSPAQVVTDALKTQEEVSRRVRTVGNPVLFTDRSGKTWLFYVTVSMGGWSGSALNLKYTTDAGASWTPARRLILSPFFNLSNLVRTAPFYFADGTIGLPAYHECIAKRPELVRLSPDGEVLGMTRMAHGEGLLQPSIVPVGPTRAIALMRTFTRGITEADTDDGGLHWTAPRKIALPAPNSSIMALRLANGRMLLVFNNHPKDRMRMSLAISKDDGRTWAVVHEFQEGEGEGEYSYPYVIQAANGDIHLTYSWNTKRIKHVTFNLAWLEGKR